MISNISNIIKMFEESEKKKVDENRETKIDSLEIDEV